MNELDFNKSIGEHATALKVHALRFTNDEDDADDLVQDTLMKALRFRESYQDGTNLKGWLFTILKNTFLNNYRKNSRKREQVIQQEEITSQHLTHSASENLGEGNFVMNDIKKALILVPEVYRAPFVRFFEGYKYQEIAEEYGIPLGTVKTRIYMAREMLKKYLKMYQTGNQEISKQELPEGDNPNF